jgi:hypothetical protein
MSKAHGKIERAILAATEKEPGALIPVLEIARDHGYDITKRATQHAWHRAAHCLQARGEISERPVFPRSPDREVVTLRDHMLCVGVAVDWHEVLLAAAERCGEVFNVYQPLRASQKTPMRSEAEFVLQMIETGRWTVADRRTGKPVDHHATWLASDDYRRPRLGRNRQLYRDAKRRTCLS